MRLITEAGELKGKKTLVRVDWNVLNDKNEVTEPFRIEASTRTLNYLKDAGAEMILLTHLDYGDTSALQKYVPEGATLLPNVRENAGEVENSEEFARELASKADLFVNEAFGVSHRKHASVVGVPKFLPSFAGFRLTEEVEHLSKAFSPSHPFLFILGGAKIETKIPLLEKFLKTADTIFVGGKNAQPLSLMEVGKNPKILYPLGDKAALEANEETLKLLEEKINQSEFILWNGPLGKYEDGYREGTLKLAQMIAGSGKISIVGGGDTIAAIQELNLFDKFTFVSTGGGAMLDFLATGTLPGIEVLG